MISINLSIDQLIEADREMALSNEQEEIVLQRQKAYSTRNMEAYSLDELKVMLRYTEE